MFKGEFVFPRRFAERIVFGKELPGFTIRRTPQELGVVGFKHGRDLFGELAKARSHGITGELPEQRELGTSLESYIMQIDVREVRLSLLNAVIYHLSEYRMRKKEKLPSGSPEWDEEDMPRPADWYDRALRAYERQRTEHKEEAQFLFSFGSELGLLSSHDKKFIKMILSELERGKWWGSYRYDAEEKLKAFLREHEEVIKGKPPVVFETVEQKIRELKKRVKKALVGVFLGTVRPPHPGHTAIIQYLLQFCDSLVVMIDSDEKVNWVNKHKDPDKKNRITAGTSIKLLNLLPCLSGEYDFAVTGREKKYNNTQLIKDLQALQADFVFAPEHLAGLIKKAGARRFPLERDLGIHSGDLEEMIRKEYERAFRNALGHEPKLQRSGLVQVDMKLNFPWNFDK